MDEIISVIIPVYNVKDYLAECIQSVLRQSYPHLEILLVDDGSTDGSGELCDRYAGEDARIHVLHQENGGLSAARNAGLQQAKGTYVYFLDSDDWIERDTLEVLKNCVHTENAEMVFFDAHNFCDGEAAVPQTYVRKQQYATEQGYEVLTKLLDRKEYHSAVPLLFFQASFLKKHALRFAEGVVYEDMLFTYMAYCLAERVAYVPKAFYQRRMRQGSIMNSRCTAKNVFSAITIYQALVDFTQRIGKMESMTAKRYIARMAANGINRYASVTYQEKRKCRVQYRSFVRNVLEHNAFDDKALKLRCYGRIPWLAYKIYEKTIGSVGKGG